MKLLDLKPVFLKYWKELTILILLITCATQCNSNSDLDTKLFNLEKEKTKSEINVQHYLDLNNSLKNKVVNYEKEISNLQKVNKEKELVLLKIKETTKSKLTKVNTYKTSDVKQYFEDRYKVVDIPLQAKGVVLKDSISYLVIQDLIIGDSSLEELKITNEILINEKEQSIQKDSIINIQKQQIKNSDNIIIEKDNINELTQTQLNKTVKTLNTERKLKGVWKYIAIGTTIISGTLILNK